jgi:hypothetical protein
MATDPHIWSNLFGSGIAPFLKLVALGVALSAVTALVSASGGDQEHH